MTKKDNSFYIIRKIYLLILMVFLMCSSIFIANMMQSSNQQRTLSLANDYHLASDMNIFYIIEEIDSIKLWLRDQALIKLTGNHDEVHIGATIHERMLSFKRTVELQTTVLGNIYAEFSQNSNSSLYEHLLFQTNLTLTRIEDLISRESYDALSIDNALLPLESITHQLQRLHENAYKALRHDESAQDNQLSQIITAVIIFMVLITVAVIFSILQSISDSLKPHEERQAALNESEGQVRLLLDSTGEAILGFDRQGACTFANRSCVNMLGYASVDNMMRKSIDELVNVKETGDHLNHQPRDIDDLLHSRVESHSDNEAFYRLDGSCIDVEYWSHPVTKDGEHVGTVITFVDISQRKSIEDKLHRSDDTLNKAQSIAHIGSWNWDIKTGALEWSDEIYRIFGLDKDSFEASYSAFLDQIHPDDLELVTSSVNDAIECRDKPYDIEHRIVRPTGELRYVHESGQIYLDAAGEPVRMVGTVHDISERKAIMDEIVLLNSELEARVDQRTNELQVTNRDLNQSLSQLQQAQKQLVESEKMASLGGLVAGVAHEINTPVGVSVTAASYLEMKVEQFTTLYENDQMTRSELEMLLSTASESSQLILANLQRAADLIRSFKQVAVDQTGDQQRLFKIRQYLEEISRSLNPKLKVANHKIVIHCDERLELYSQPGAFSQLFTNLVMNSVIHGFEEKEGGEILIAVEARDREFKIRYRDNGRGIDAEHLDKIFDPFFTTKRHKGGSGLGMNIVYNLVTQTFGGTIECHSALGEGIDFYIVIPVPEVELKLAAV